MEEIRIARERLIEAPPERLWPLIEDVSRLSEWFTFAERTELLEGPGLGRKQRIHGRWGRKPSEIDQVVIAYEPNHLLAWEHEAERLAGKPAPRFARRTVFSIRLEPEGQSTRVQMDSVQEPASALKGAVMRMFGTREVARHIARSLERLAKVARA